MSTESLCPICGTVHRRGIGGTMMARIFGLVPKTNALDVYHRLTRPPVVADDADDDESIDQVRGHDLEEMAAARYWETTGRRGRRVSGPITHPDYPAFVGHVDRIIVADDDREEGKRDTGILEIKNPRSSKFGRVIDYGMFQSETIQTMTYGAVGRKAWGSVAWHNLENNRGPLYYVDLVFDPAMLRFILEAGQRFYDEHVVPRVPPDPTEWELLAKEDAPKLTVVTGELVVLEDPEAERIAGAFVEARDVRSKGDALYERAEASMREWMKGRDLKRAELPSIGKFSMVQSEGRASFSEKSLRLSRPLDWDYVREWMRQHTTYTDAEIDGVLPSLELDLGRFRRMSDPYEYVLPPRAKGE